jgi:hypothetical protein
MTPTVNLDQRPEVKAFFDPQSNTISYVVKDPMSNACAAIYTVMQLDQASGRLSYESADKIIAHINE